VRCSGCAEAAFFVDIRNRDTALGGGLGARLCGGFFCFRLFLFEAHASTGCGNRFLVLDAVHFFLLGETAFLLLFACCNLRALPLRFIVLAQAHYGFLPLLCDTLLNRFFCAACAACEGGS
jgi:hypothetical protein